MKTRSFFFAGSDLNFELGRPSTETYKRAGEISLGIAEALRRAVGPLRPRWSERPDLEALCGALVLPPSVPGPALHDKTVPRSAKHF